MVETPKDDIHGHGGAEDHGHGGTEDTHGHGGKKKKGPWISPQTWGAMSQKLEMGKAVFTTSRLTTGNLANLLIGSAGVAHTVADVAHRPLATVGFESHLLNAVPVVGMGLAVLNMLGAAGDFVRMGKNHLVRDWRHLDNVIAFATNANLFRVLYANHSQAMTIGSTSFGMACDASGIVALGNFIEAARRFYTASKMLPKGLNAAGLAKLVSDNPEEEDVTKINAAHAFVEARQNLGLATVNMIGFGALSAAYHLAGTATAAAAPALIPTLLAIGSVALVAGALYVGYNVAKDCYGKSAVDFGITAAFAASHGARVTNEAALDKVTADKGPLYAPSRV